MYGDVLVAVDPAKTERCIEASALRPMFPQGAAGTRVKRLEPAVARAVEEQPSGRDQSAGRDRQSLRHAPHHAPLDRIPGPQLALHLRSSGWLRSGAWRASQVADLAAGVASH